jgi:hypothetical protein
VRAKSVYTGAPVNFSCVICLNDQYSIVPDSKTPRSHKIFRRIVVDARSAYALHGDEIKLMINCPKCGAAVRAEKAFCHNCGSPMDAAMANRATPMPDFGATMLEPPKRAAQPFVPPANTAIQPTGRETGHVSHSFADVASSAQPGAPPVGRRKSFMKLGFGFVLLLLFLMFAVFVLALWLD